jgi:hypothetical protein
MFECETMDEFADVLSEVFEDGFEGVLVDVGEDVKHDNEMCDCSNCDCMDCEHNTLTHHDPEYITTLKLGKNNDIWVDIMDSGDMFEAWLYRKNMGVKDYMFGIQKVNCGGEAYYDLDDFIDIVCGNVAEHLEFYDEQYGD